LHADIPGSTLAVVPDARHFIPEEAPEKTEGADILAALEASLSHARKKKQPVHA
jgi:pimeloyl-ACP methyl ester carboxylesterase